ncbi:hypothetical protein J6590_067636 [Homalodisca vitripennis]|nr:hypothetical protein J6590_067636 [Homalodisca vitripennis]
MARGISDRYFLELRSLIINKQHRKSSGTEVHYYNSDVPSRHSLEGGGGGGISDKIIPDICRRKIALDYSREQINQNFTGCLLSGSVRTKWVINLKFGKQLQSPVRQNPTWVARVTRPTSYTYKPVVSNEDFLADQKDIATERHPPQLSHVFIRYLVASLSFQLGLPHYATCGVGIPALLYRQL